MRNITDNSILKLKEVVAKQLIIPNQDGYKLREVGNPFFIGNDIILIYTMDKDLKEQRLYYSYCNKNGLTKWIHKGKLKINRELEDPFLTIKNGVFSFMSEDRKKPDKYSICEYLSQNWKYKTNKGTWHFSGTKYETPGGAMYSPLSFTENGKDYTFAEKRYGSKYKDIDIVDANTNKILLKHDSKWNVLVPDDIYKINDKYVQFGHGLYHRGKSDQRWAHFIATSDKLLSGWKIISEPISPAGIVLIYTDKWNYLCEGSGGLYLGEAKFNNDSKSKNGGNMKPKIRIENNKLICETVLSATQYSWQYSKTPGKYDGWIGFGKTLDIKTELRIGGYEFWCYATVGGERTLDSNRVVYKVDSKEELEEPPTDNEVYKANIKTWASKILLEADKIK